MNEEKIYFSPGEVVTLRQAMRSPEMLVTEIVKRSADNKAPLLLGVECLWFDDNMHVQKHRFSTKDLRHVE